MAAFSDFLDLRTAVIEVTKRPGQADVMPRLVALAEVGMNRRLRSREQIATTSVTFTDGSAALPTDFLEVIGLFDGQGQEFPAQPLQNVQRSTGSQRYYFTIEGVNLVMTGAVGPHTLKYYQTIPTIADSSLSSNWVLQKHPALYLHAVVYEAAKHAQDVDLATATLPMVEAEYRDAAARDDRDRYARARVRLPGIVP